MNDDTVDHLEDINWIRRADVARLFRVNGKTVTRWEEEGKLKVRTMRTIGGHRRYSREDIERVIAERIHDNRET